MLTLKIQRILASEDKKFNNKLMAIHEMLGARKIDEMNIANSRIDSLLGKKEVLVAQNRSLSKKIIEKSNRLTGGDKENLHSFSQLEAWAFQKNLALDQESSGLETQVTQLRQVLDKSIIDLENSKNDFDSLSIELISLKKEDKQLSKPDQIEKIQDELLDLQKQNDELLRSAAEISSVKYSRSFDIGKQIARFQANLKQIAGRLKTLSSPLPESGSHPSPKTGKKSSSKADKQLTEIETIVQQVKDSVLDLQNRLASLESLEKKLLKVKQLQKTAQFEIQGEYNHLKKKQARNNMINSFVEDKKTQKSRIADNEKGIKEIKTRMKDLEYKKKGVLNQKTSCLQQLDQIKIIGKEYTENGEKIKELTMAIEAITPSSKIWEDSIRKRIMRVRREISQGNPITIMFCPRRAAFRFRLSHFIRKEVIIVERELQLLGFLKKTYLERIDVFNRKRRDGQQLYLGILNL